MSKLRFVGRAAGATKERFMIIDQDIIILLVKIAAVIVFVHDDDV